MERNQVMCLYPKLIKNPKYKANKKNGGVIPAIRDKRVMAVPIGCGRCAECIKKKANEWKVRLYEEVKTNKNGQFVTLTFNNESYSELAKTSELKGYELDNYIATLATRRFLERWRKKHKKSVKHWLVTELGHNGTENIHLHGILWTDASPSTIRNIWGYGYVWAGYNDEKTYVNDQTINYITKYITKSDEKHKYYQAKILTSKGIGKGYLNSFNALNAKFSNETKDYYITPTGHKIALPIYYRNKIYSDDEKETLWLKKLDKEIRYVDKIKIDVSQNQEEYINIRNAARKKYIQLGYNGEYKWKEEQYENERRELIQGERIIKEEQEEQEDMGKYRNENNWY